MNHVVFEQLAHCIALLYSRLSDAEVDEIELVIRAMHKATS